MGVPLRASAVRDRVDGPLWSRYRTYLPDASVRGFGDRGWRGQAAWDRWIRILPDGCADLIAHEGRLVAVLPAPRVSRRWLRADDRPVGLRIRCGAAGALLGCDLSDLAGGLAGEGGEVDLTELSPELARSARAALGAGGGQPRPEMLDALVRARQRAGRRPDPAVLHAVRLLRAPDSRVDRVAAELGLTPRTLHRRVRAEVGFGPKRLQRVFRFQRFLAGLPVLARGEVGLAELAAALGYADQSHLGRDCALLAGTSPARLLASWTHSRRDPHRPGTNRGGAPIQPAGA